MIGFLFPAMLLALIILPVLWWMLRAVPPSPSHRRFPGVRLLLGLKDPESTPKNTPWWLLLLRLAAIGAAIVAFAEPVLNPRPTTGGSGRLLVLMDAGWASAQDWDARQQRLSEILAGATRDNRNVSVRLLSDPLPVDSELAFTAAQDWVGLVAGLHPAPFAPDRQGFAAWLAAHPQDPFETIWISDGLGQGDALSSVLLEQGPVSVVGAQTPRLALLPAQLSEDGLSVPVLRERAGQAQPVTLLANGPTPEGFQGVLWRAEAEFAPDETRIDVTLEMPLELRNRIGSITVLGVHSAGAVMLADSGLQRRKVALYSPRRMEEGPQLVSSLFFLRKALEPTAEVIEAGLDDLLLAAPDVLVFADVDRLSPEETAKVLEFVQNGGTLLRFAGPRLAAGTGPGMAPDPLLPVPLRAGGRTLGGAMTWTTPKRLRPFPETSPFAGLRTPDEVEIRAQVLAQPGPDLPEHVMAALEDGTPLVTGMRMGAGRIILFHVTANAEWSSLPLSGLFVDMLSRLSVSAGGGAAEVDDLLGQTWAPREVLDGFGDLTSGQDLPSVAGETLANGPRDAATPPGYYTSQEREVAINLLAPDTVLEPLSGLASGVTRDGFGEQVETPLKPVLLAVALLLLSLDILATLFVSGRLVGARAAAGIMVAVLAYGAQDARAQDDRALLAANNVVLAYVVTGDEHVDLISRAGLYGLADTLKRRTSIEPIDPMAIDLETDDISLVPFLYWPITAQQPALSADAVAKVNAYMRNGGMILFDTRDAQLGGGFGGGSANGLILQRIAAQLEIPPLAPIEQDHVLTRSFYLLEVFPGRWRDGTLWVEAPTNLTTIEGAPFRNLNDGVTPVVIGGNDWAAAWAISPSGRPVYPVGRGVDGDRQREIAKRFGVNLIMYVMTGNYKSDQVHVPALLERLGQ